MTNEDMKKPNTDPRLQERAICRHHTGREYLNIVIAREEDLGVDLVIHRGLHDGRVWARTVENFLGSKDGETPRFTFVEMMTEREEKLLAQQYHDLARLTSGMAGAENYTEGFVVGMVDDQGRVVGPYYAREIVDWESCPRHWSLDIDEAVIFDTEAQAQTLLTEMSRKIDHQSNLAVKHVYRFNPLSWGTPSEAKIEPSLMPQQVQQIPVPQAANSDERQQQILVLMEEIFRDNQLTMDRTLALLGEIEGAAVAMRATLTDP